MYYLLWIGESADNIHAPTCELATELEYSMYEYCENFVNKHYPDGQYVVMFVKTVSVLPFTDGKCIYTQTTSSVSEFIRIYKEKNKNEI